jgi:hypothetical protein
MKISFKVFFYALGHSLFQFLQHLGMKKHIFLALLHFAGTSFLWTRWMVEVVS